MFNPEYNEEYATFVLKYASKNGLHDIVSRLSVDEDQDNLQADLQPDLIQAFATSFPEVDLKELDNAVLWVLLTSIARLKEKQSEAQ
jgi:hypothetical protein